MVTSAQWQPDAAALKYMIQPPPAPPSLNTSAFLCCCHHKPAWCLLLAPPSATEICLGQHGGNDRSGLLVHMCVLAILQNGTVFKPSDHLQPNYSPLWHLCLWAIRPDRFQQEGSNGVVNVSLEGMIQNTEGKKSQALVEMEIMQMFEMEREGGKEVWLTPFDLFTSFFLLTLLIFSRACTLK